MTSKTSSATPATNSIHSESTRTWTLVCLSLAVAAISFTGCEEKPASREDEPSVSSKVESLESKVDEMQDAASRQIENHQPDVGLKLD